ncbi:MAG: zinc ribbon domain-containing protein [Actinobacteria bacterium]|nr:zinc ribbon domain-containing protein [Actinomycetota bacterium]
MDARKQARLTPIATALGQLGYTDPLVWDAALRMSWVPDLAADLQAYAAAGAAAGPGHPSALRSLPEGYTVGYLMTAYGFSPTEAFLMGAALITHTTEAIEALKQYYHHGRSATRPDGSYAIVYPPAAASAAPHRASDPAFRDSEEVEILDLPVEPGAAGRSAAANVFCTACGKALTAGTAFCESCGAKVG